MFHVWSAGQIWNPPVSRISMGTNTWHLLARNNFPWCDGPPRTGDGRISMAGLNPGNVEQLAPEGHSLINRGLAWWMARACRCCSWMLPYSDFVNLPVGPHKAVAEVSKIEAIRLSCSSVDDGVTGCWSINVWLPRSVDLLDEFTYSSIFLFVYLSENLTAYLPVHRCCLSIFLSFCLYACLTIKLSIHLPTFSL